MPQGVLHSDRLGAALRGGEIATILPSKTNEVKGNTRNPEFVVLPEIGLVLTADLLPIDLLYVNQYIR